MVNRGNIRVKARFKKIIITETRERQADRKLEKESRREALLQRVNPDPLSPF